MSEFQIMYMYRMCVPISLLRLEKFLCIEKFNSLFHAADVIENGQGMKFTPYSANMYSSHTCSVLCTYHNRVFGCDLRAFRKFFFFYKYDTS